MPTHDSTLDVALSGYRKKPSAAKARAIIKTLRQRAAEVDRPADEDIPWLDSEVDWSYLSVIAAGSGSTATYMQPLLMPLIRWCGDVADLNAALRFIGPATDVGLDWPQLLAQWRADLQRELLNRPSDERKRRAIVGHWLLVGAKFPSLSPIDWLRLGVERVVLALADSPRNLHSQASGAKPIAAARSMAKSVERALIGPRKAEHLAETVLSLALLEKLQAGRVTALAAHVVVLEERVQQLSSDLEDLASSRASAVTSLKECERGRRAAETQAEDSRAALEQAEGAYQLRLRQRLAQQGEVVRRALAPALDQLGEWLAGEAPPVELSQRFLEQLRADVNAGLG